MLDALRRKGVNFTTAYSTWDSTPPSHFSMLTGYVNGITSDIDEPDASVAYQLHKLGYHSFGVVANYNLSPKAQRSLIPFENFVNLAEEFQSMPPEQMNKYLPDIEAALKARHATPGDAYTTMIYYAAPNVVARTAEALDKLHGEGPFLGFLNFMDTHDPYRPSPKFYDYSKEPPDLSSPRSRSLPQELTTPDAIADPQRKAYVLKKIEQAQGRAWSVALGLSREQLDAYRRRYYAQARELDDGIGKLIDVLRRRGLLDSTILVFTSDHGEAFGEGGLLTHSFDNLGDREVTNRVNLLFVFPSCYGFKGLQIDQYCTIADIVPTLYDLLGIDTAPLREKSTPGNYGRSLLPLIAGHGPQRYRAVGDLQ